MSDKEELWISFVMLAATKARVYKCKTEKLRSLTYQKKSKLHDERYVNVFGIGVKPFGTSKSHDKMKIELGK